jgi:RHS repeat-associated protein
LKSTGAEWFTFYGAKGEKLGVYALDVYMYGESSFSQISGNVWFAGKLIWDANAAVIQDRLGSNRATGNTMGYYPYGEEITATSNDREKFATYTRDSYTGLDYADQRFYASTYGRFSTPDPYRKSARRHNPGSWNRYTYVNGDPVNRQDPSGLLDYSCGLVQDVEGGVCPFDDNDIGPSLSGGYLANFYPDGPLQDDGSLVDVTSVDVTDTLDDVDTDPSDTDQGDSTTDSAPNELQCNAGFIAASNAAWIRAGIGLKDVEAGFWVTGPASAPAYFPLPFTNQSMTITGLNIPPAALALVHTHPNAGVAEPSPGDVNNSNLSNLPFYVLSSRGLWLHMPKATKSNMLRPGLSWLKPCGR